MRYITQSDDFEIMQRSRYKTPAFVYELHSRNLLFGNEKLLYYNRNRFGDLAYVTAQ